MRGRVYVLQRANVFQRLIYVTLVINLYKKNIVKNGGEKKFDLYPLTKEGLIL
jgi:hypothetical protein